MSQTRLVFAVLGALVGAVIASNEAVAAELRVGLRASSEFQTRPFGTSAVGDAFSIRVGPTYTLVNNEGRLLYEIGSRTAYEAFLNADRDLNAWEQTVNADLSYAISPRMLVSFEERLSYAGSIRFDNQGTTGVIDGGRDRFVRNTSSVTLTHSFTPRLSASTTGNWELVNFVNDRDVRADDRSFGQTTSANYRLSESDSLGLGYGTAYQEFDSAPPRSASTALIHRAFALWSHRFDDTFRFSAQLGPAFVSSEIPAQGLSSSRATVFGSASLEKSWRRLSGEFSFRREQNSATGEGASTSFNRAALDLAWELDRVWGATAQAGWSRRSTFTSLAGVASVDVRQWTGLISVTRRLSQFSSASLQLRYFNQQASNRASGFRDSENFAAVFRVDYGLKPFHFDFL